MDDDKHYTIQIKGTAYRFRPIPEESIERLGILSHLQVPGTKVFKALAAIVAESAGEDQWDELTDRYVAGKLSHTDITSDLLKKLIKRQAEDKSSADDDE